MILKSTSAGFYSKRSSHLSCLEVTYFVSEFVRNDPGDLFASDFSLKIVTFDGNETLLQCATGDHVMQKFHRQTSTKAKTWLVELLQQREVGEEKDQCQTIIEIFHSIGKRWISRKSSRRDSSLTLLHASVHRTSPEQHDRVCIPVDCFVLFLHASFHFELLLWSIVEDRTKKEENRDCLSLFIGVRLPSCDETYRWSAHATENECLWQSNTFYSLNGHDLLFVGFLVRLDRFLWECTSAWWWAKRNELLKNVVQGGSKLLTENQLMSVVTCAELDYGWRSSLTLPSCTRTWRDETEIFAVSVERRCTFFCIFVIVGFFVVVWRNTFKI